MMKKAVPLFFIFFASLSAIHARPWVDDAFLLVETENPKKIQRAIETDYSLRNFTRYAEKENLLMAALKYSRGNDIITLLLDDARIDPDSKTKNGVSALMYACQYETDIEAIKSVLFKNARSDSKKANRILLKDKDGQNCFDYARKNEVMSQEVIDLLSLYAQEPFNEVEEPVQEEPAEPDEPAEEVPFGDFAEEFDIPQLPDEKIAPAPVVVAQVDEKEMVEPPKADVNSLVDIGAVSAPVVIPESIYLYDYADDKFAALAIPESLIAAENASHKFIKNANERDSAGRTKLMMAAKKGDINRIEDLLYSGAEINARDEEGWTALMYAARFQPNPDVTKLLLFKGADRAAKNRYGLSSLLLAAGYSENPEVVAILLETYSALSDEAREAFAYGISNYNSTNVLQAFIDKRVPVNIPYDGKTPLMVACATNKNTKIIEWLLENGASKYQIEASTGKTAYDYAKENRKLPHNIAYWSLNPNS